MQSCSAHFSADDNSRTAQTYACSMQALLEHILLCEKMILSKNKLSNEEAICSVMGMNCTMMTQDSTDRLSNEDCSQCCNAPENLSNDTIANISTHRMPLQQDEAHVSLHRKNHARHDAGTAHGNTCSP
jgi:hypothetical protein